GVMLLGQERLGLGAGLKGTGMCLTTRGLRRVPWKASGLVEDLEFSWKLHALGEHIHFAHETRVRSDMLTSRGPAAASQRLRWESGRRAIPAKYLGVILTSTKLGLYRKVLYTLQMTLPPMSSLAVVFLGAMSIHTLAMLDARFAPLASLLILVHAAMAV